MIITVKLENNSYDIIIKRGSLQNADEYFDLDRKVLIVTDSGVPCEYSLAIKKLCKQAVIVTVPFGEESKSIDTYKMLLETMLKEEFNRKDCVVAVGGGVVGDLAGFTAASYMRGIDFYNIPTTLLSQVDSSIGGKTAVNLNGHKNSVGAFYQPKKVLIDSELLKTLPPRQISNGLAEAVKMSLTHDASLFNLIETQDIYENIDEIIIKSLKIKRNIIVKDEKEQSLRKVLNFGHTIGHAIESEENLHGLYHGECVALGMIPMCSEEVRARLIPLLNKLNLKTELSFNEEKVLEALLHDKKSETDKISTVEVESVGSFKFSSKTISDLKERLEIIKIKE